MAKAKNTQNTTGDETKQTVSNDDGFQVWTPDSKKKNPKPFPFWVKLSKNSIVLSKTLKLAVGNTIQIAFNKDTQTMRLKSTDQEPAVNCETKIYAKQFFNDFGINIEEPKKYEANFKDDCYYIQL